MRMAQAPQKIAQIKLISRIDLGTAHWDLSPIPQIRRFRANEVAKAQKDLQPAALQSDRVE
jgi:hypothetical protein